MVKQVQPSFTKGEISPKLHGRVDTGMYREALRTARNAIVHTFGGISNRPGAVFIGPTKVHDDDQLRLIPFQFNTTDQYMLEFGNLYMRVIRNDGHVVETAVNISGIATTALAKITTATSHGYSNGDEVFLDAIGGMIELENRRVLVANVTSTTFTIQDQYTGTDIDSTNFTAYTSGGTVAKIFTLTTPYISADLAKLKYVQSADTMTLTHTGYDTRDLTRPDHDVWTLDVISWAPDTTAPTNVAVVADTTGAVTYEYGVTVINTTTFEESLVAEDTIANGAVTVDNTITWDAHADALQYKVYRKENGLYGFIGATEATTFKDANIDPDTLQGPPIARDPFSGVDNDPGAVTYYEQRLIMGGTLNNPDTLFASRTGNRRNLSIRFPLQPDDAIVATLDSLEVNEIRHLAAAASDLLVFTSGSEWRANSGASPGFSTINLDFKPQSAWGCSHLRPLRVGGEYLFAEDGNARVRALAFDALNTAGYTTTDLNFLTDHLLADQAPDEYILKDWCFQYFPEPRLIAVRTDGMIITATYDKVTQTIGWTTWDTEGNYEATASLRRNISSVEDGVYFIVKRRVLDDSGNTIVIRTIEKLHTRKFADERDAFFLDAGVSYDPQINITGIAESGDNIVITTDGPHGYAVDDVVELGGIIWELTIDALGNDEEVDFLNDHRFIIEAITSNSFTITCAGEVFS